MVDTTKRDLKIAAKILRPRRRTAAPVPGSDDILAALRPVTEADLRAMAVSLDELVFTGPLPSLSDHEVAEPAPASALRTLRRRSAKPVTGLAPASKSPRPRISA